MQRLIWPDLPHLGGYIPLQLHDFMLCNVNSLAIAHFLVWEVGFGPNLPDFLVFKWRERVIQ